jgi:hypothetical protein
VAPGLPDLSRVETCPCPAVFYPRLCSRGPSLAFGKIMKWIVRILVLVGLIALFECAVVLVQLGSNDGLKHASPFVIIRLFFFALLAFVGAYGCAKRKFFGWVSVLSLLLLVSIFNIGSQVYYSVGFRLPPSYYFGLTIRAAFLAWLLFLWVAQLKQFRVNRHAIDPSPADPEKTDPKKNLTAIMIWCFFGLCCLPFLYRAVFRLIILFWMFTHGSVGP